MTMPRDESADGIEPYRMPEQPTVPLPPYRDASVTQPFSGATSSPRDQVVPYVQSGPVAHQPSALPSAAAGWYPDQRSGLMRWWDGTRWTENFGPRVATVPMVAAKDTAVAYLLLIFLGGLGIHRFYLGHTGSAVAMLLLYIIGAATTWLIVGFLLLGAVWIWQIVDLFLMPAMVRERNARG